MASEIITNTYLGTFANHGKIVIALLPNVYMVGAKALGTVNANSTVRNLPKPPQGDKTAWMSPPTEFPPSKPVFQESVYGAEAAKTTPME